MCHVNQMCHLLLHMDFTVSTSMFMRFWVRRLKARAFLISAVLRAMTSACWKEWVQNLRHLIFPSHLSAKWSDICAWKTLIVINFLQYLQIFSNARFGIQRRKNQFFSLSSTSQYPPAKIKQKKCRQNFGCNNLESHSSLWAARRWAQTPFPLMFLQANWVCVSIFVHKIFWAPFSCETMSFTSNGNCRSMLLTLCLQL